MTRSLCAFALFLLASTAAAQPSPPRVDGVPIPRWPDQRPAPDPKTRREAALKLAPYGPPAVPTLLVTLQDEDAEVRQNALASLGTIGTGAKTAAPSVLPLLKDPN